MNDIRIEFIHTSFMFMDLTNKTLKLKYLKKYLKGNVLIEPKHRHLRNVVNVELQVKSKTLSETLLCFHLAALIQSVR